MDTRQAALHKKLGSYKNHGSSGSHDGKNHLATFATVFGFAPRRLGCVGKGTDELGSTVWHTFFNSKVIAFIFSSSSHIQASNALYFSA
jgi:hypothetical protein